MSTKQYTVHEHGSVSPGEVDPDAVFVHDGFALFAFIFSVLWFLVYRLWAEAALVFAGLMAIVLITLGGDIGAPAGNGLRLVYALAVGVFANDIRRAALARKGFREAGVVCAGSREEAEIAYYAERAARPGPTTPDGGTGTPPENASPAGAAV